MNEVFIADQTRVFLLSLLYGAAFCAVYDLFRILRKTVARKRVAIFFTDIIYWLIVTCATLYMILIYCTGYVRGYVLVGIVLGFIIFRLTLSPLLLKVMYGALKLVKGVCRVIVIPFKFLAHYLNLAVNRLQNAAAHIYMRIKTHILQKKSVRPSKKA